MMKRKLLAFILILSCFGVFAQKPLSGNAGEIKQRLKKLNVLGSVLYVAAHPDDENTQLISYFANEELLRTAYLSATRGDGGQNLIGPEIREKLGLIRTQELLAARSIDGGQQFFSRANDFGYSKHPDETLNIWDREKVLSDFVRVIRKFRPDVIVTRFSLKPGVTHGHHTTSAILAKEAFSLAGDPEAFPEQLDELEVWQPTKIFWNTSWWYYRNSGEEMDTAAFIQLNVGKYNPNLGISYTEMSAYSRSMHKSQGFGSTGRRGDDIEYLEQWGGVETGDILGGVETSWDRVEGSEQVKKHLIDAEKSYDPEDPYATLSSLYKARLDLMKLPDQFWKEIKLKEIDDLVQIISGLYLEVVAGDYSYVAGDSIKLSIEAISRVDNNLQLESMIFEPWGVNQNFEYELKNNKAFNSDISLVIPEGLEISNPYWLKKAGTVGMYEVENPSFIGLPENPNPLNVRFTLKWEEQYIDIVRPIVYKRNDPVKGEIYRPIVISPPVMTNLSSSILIFNGQTSKEVEVRVIAGRENISGKVQLKMPKDWKVEPSSYDFKMGLKNEEGLFSFTITAPKQSSVEDIIPEVILSDGKRYSKGIDLIQYDHIPIQTIFPDSKLRVVKIDIEKFGNNIGYIQGAGDEIPQSLEQIGYNVKLLEKDDILEGALQSYDAIVLGIRAFNTVDWLSYKNEILFDYVNDGGTLIVQYNTTRGLVTDQLAPYPLKLSRDRVTVEDAKVEILEPSHPVFNVPNKITDEDFEDWVQERGLYFPNEWGDEFTPLLSSNDPGEEARKGGLLIAKYGKGNYIYTGYSWFRELPAGVPGAFRIFANLLSIGSSENKNQ